MRVKELRRSLISEEPGIVHFSGHGSKDDGIILEDKDGVSKYIAPEALEDLFRILNEDEDIECVLLNACYSEDQAKAIANYVPNGIGMSSKVTNEAAIAFSIGFYDGIAAGKPYFTAFELGKNAIAMDGHVEKDIAVFFGKKE